MLTRPEEEEEDLIVPFSLLLLIEKGRKPHGEIPLPCSHLSPFSAATQMATEQKVTRRQRNEICSQLWKKWRFMQCGEDVCFVFEDFSALTTYKKNLPPTFAADSCAFSALWHRLLALSFFSHSTPLGDSKELPLLLLLLLPLGGLVVPNCSRVTSVSREHGPKKRGGEGHWLCSGDRNRLIMDEWCFVCVEQHTPHMPDSLNVLFFFFFLVGGGGGGEREELGCWGEGGVRWMGSFFLLGNPHLLSSLWPLSLLTYCLDKC